MEQGPYEYDVFISYCRKDYLDDNLKPKIVSAIGTILEYLKANGIRYWIDVENDAVGDNHFIGKIADSLGKSRTVLFISSKESVESDWVIDEVKYARKLKKQIFPLLIDDTPKGKTLDFLLADSDDIAFYKNEKVSLEKLVKLMLDSKGQEEKDVIRPAQKFREILLLVAIGFAIFAVCFSLLFTIGCAYGYFSNVKSMEKIADSAFMNGQIHIVDEHTIEFNDNARLRFRYNLESHELMDLSSSSILKGASFKEILVSLSFTSFLQTLTKNIKVNSKVKVVYVVVGCIGFFCGFGIGSYYGKQFAENESIIRLQKYLDTPSVNMRLQEMMDQRKFLSQ